jgi:hypothetical protein
MKGNRNLLMIGQVENLMKGKALRFLIDWGYYLSELIYFF